MPRPSVLVKRVIDIAGASLLLIVSVPIQLLAAIAILIEDGPPVFFSQSRSGRYAATFRVRKFRSMKRHDVAPVDLGQVTLEHPLVTRTGLLLRRSKIDELPQLSSVLRGDMSLVGPRPTLPEQVEEYGEFEMRRLFVKPGLTGWAQVNGAILLSWPDRILLDIWYIDNWSLWLDVRVLIKTLMVVFRGERVNHEALRLARSHAERMYRVTGGSAAQSPLGERAIRE